MSTGLRFFRSCHCAELNKIVKATIPVNPYDDRKVSRRRPHGNGDLDIVRASYTCRKANVTEALPKSEASLFVQVVPDHISILIASIYVSKTFNHENIDVYQSTFFLVWWPSWNYAN